MAPEKLPTPQEWLNVIRMHCPECDQPEVSLGENSWHWEIGGDGIFLYCGNGHLVFSKRD